MSGRTVISDGAWARLEPRSPDQRPRRGGRWRDHRQVLEGIAWHVRTIPPWRELPDRFGPWQTACERHQRAGARTGRGRGCWLRRRHARTRPVSWTGSSRPTPRWCGCTSTGRPRPRWAATPPLWSVRCGARCGSQGERSNYKKFGGEPARRGDEQVIAEPDDHAIGRSRGGLTTKIHMISDGRGRPLVLGLTGGNINDTLMFAQLMDSVSIIRAGPGRPRSRPDYVLGDKGYSSRANRRRRGSRAVVRSASTRSATSSATSSNGASASSNSGVGWPAATTNTPATTSAAYNSQRYWPGSDDPSDTLWRNSRVDPVSGGKISPSTPRISTVPMSRTSGIEGERRDAAAHPKRRNWRKSGATRSPWVVAAGPAAPSERARRPTAAAPSGGLALTSCRRRRALGLGRCGVRETHDEGRR